jgi:uridine kinase
MKILAITGGSGSGKSTVLRALADHLGPRSSMLSLDDYYRPKEELPMDGNGETNFDLPEAIDHVALHRDIVKLSRGEQVSFQSYT